METLYLAGDAFFKALLQEMQAAQRKIMISVYIFKDDVLGQKIAKILREARERGVDVYLLMDGFGSLSLSPFFTAQLQLAGIRVKHYHPFPFTLQKGLGESPSFWRRLLERLWRLNKRNHQKIFIIDDRIAYTGSFNISATHLAQVFQQRHWIDVGVRLADDRARAIQENYLALWYRPGIRHRRWLNRHLRRPNSPVRANINKRLRSFFRKDLKRRIRDAQETLWIVTPYFGPSTRLLGTLVRKAKKSPGLIKILLPTQNDVDFYPIVQTFTYAQLLHHGVEIYEYPHHFVHAKITLIDDWCMVGSSNMNRRSLLHDLELDVVIQEDQNRAKLRDFIQKLQQESHRVTLEDLASTRMRRFLFGLFYRFFKKYL